MTINRHPLQSIGVGQNSRMLPDEAVVPYCDALGERLGWLADALGQEQKEGRLSIAAAKAAQAFLRETRATILVMALKHGRQLLDIEPLPLTIDPTESGMPTFKDFWTLREDRERAEEQLRQIPAREQLLAQATDAIYAGQRPIKQQILWLQRAYMERLSATPVVADFHQQEPLRLSEKKSERLYAISWTGVIHSLNLFECVTLHFEEHGAWHVTGGIGELVQRAFAAANGAEPWMLRATIERAATTNMAKRSTVDVLFGRTPMEAGPSVFYRVLLLPLAIKQLLGDADEDGQPCAVYGVSKQGDLVC